MKILFKDGLIFPMSDNNNNISYKYMVIENDKIIYLGNEYPNIKINKIISIKDKYIYPTLTDSHMHLLYSIISSANTYNICQIVNGEIKPNNMQDIKDCLIEYTNNHQKDKLFIINNYITPAILENRLPTRTELDEWCNNKAVVVFSIDGHSASLSTTLLNKLNINSLDGIITGEQYDMNQGKITNYIGSQASLKTLFNGMVNFTNECLKYGITKVCSLDGEDDGSLNDKLLDLLVFIARRLNIMVRLYPQYHNINILNKYKNKLKNKRIGGCSKWELDGSVGSHSASFYYPYKDTNNTSNLYYDSNYLNKKIKQILDNNIQFTCHAIGTKSIDQIVIIYKNNLNNLNNINNNIIQRIDHFEFPSPQAVDFIKQNNNRLSITIQPGYSYIDKRFIHSYTRYLNEDNLQYLVKLNDLVKSNVLILGSSDSPVQSINPYDQMLGMVDYYIQEESISNYQAFKTYTTNPSIVLNEDEGRLRINHQATFFICDTNIFDTNINDLNKITADKIYINGKEIKPIKANLLTFFKFIFKKPNKI